MKAKITIKTKLQGMPTKSCEIDVHYGDEMAQIKIKEIGDTISSINPQAIVEVGYEVYSDVVHEWQQRYVHYPMSIN